MIIDDIVTAITRKKSLTNSNREPQVVIYIDDHTFREMRRETAQQPELNADEYEIIMHGTILDCKVHHVYGNSHGWRVLAV